MSNNNTYTQETTFWEFLSKNTIEIPIIQRDYAQGRLGKEYLRKSFLADIFNALDKQTKMKLDFVYGSVENDKLCPLDGQQRLTTLWLLHWYIALMSDNLTQNVCKTLAKFTYETRISSREFCENLCKHENFTTFKDFKNFKTEGKRRIVDYITSRTWFYSAWKQDPTIQSMLRMLGGTEINDKNGEEIVDGLEEIFNGTDKDTFANYWKKLTEDYVITFYQLPLENFGLSDDLYIKMNARGKQLTSFENFKADLVRYIREQNWMDLLHPTNGIPIKMDTTWTDIFWNNHSNDNRIDEIYFSFLNRFFLNELICLKDNGEYLIKAEDIEKNSVFTYLYGNKGDDTKIEYVGLEKYCFKESNLPKIYFENLNKSLDGLMNVNIPQQSFIPEWGEKKFLYIPQYDGESISTLGQKERIVFLAVSRYFQSGNYKETSFKQWMRVVWNIVENGSIDTISAMIGVMRLIDELSIHSHDIYTYLANDNNKINSNAANVQVAEERAKAKQILKNVFSETEIIDAESHPLLKGCISAIFENDDCCSVPYGQRIQDRIELLKSLWNKDNDKDYTFVKVLISYYDKERPDGKLYLKKNQEYWKSLLTDKLKNSFRKIEKKDDKGDCIGWKSMLANTNLIENSRADGKIVSTYWDGKIVLWGTNGCTWNAYGNVILDEVHKNSILVKLVDDKTIECNQIIQNSEFFDGWNIDFKYQNYFFRWYCYPKDNNPNNENRKELDVYLMMENWKDYWPRKNETLDKDTENGNYFCFKVTNVMKLNDFRTQLDCLISQQKADEKGEPCSNECGKKPINTLE